MNTRLLAALFVMPLGLADAAHQSMRVDTRQVIYDHGVRREKCSRPSYAFRVEIISDEEGLKPESRRYGHPFVAAREDERYAVRLYNPLPVRVAVNLTVDGLNSISGKPSGISDGEKWVIEPNGFIEIRGWQVNGSEARRFFFTPKHESYAQWRSETLKKNLAKNCGVIGAAFFWSQRELDAYYEARPIFRVPYIANAAEGVRAGNIISEARQRQVPKSLRIEKAGTGMGERESHPTYTVAFNYDRGMYHRKQAVVIYYDFAEPPRPDPFPALSYAPEM